MRHKTVRLETLSVTYDIPLSTLRQWAYKRKFPGIKKKMGIKQVYVDPEVFDHWFRGKDTDALET